ncbi:MAG: glycosyltransferase family 2 protein [Candidatus Obscuribacterales bacterium]|nr:glycosyltransferase family 2 protein [Candidatus Obscuribacterales bacterium]
MTTYNDTIKPIAESSNRDWSYDNQTYRRMAGNLAKPELSIVIPVYNEQDNVELLYEKLLFALTACGRTWEIIFIDDGSSDRSFAELEKLVAQDHRLKVVRFVRNYGQTAALAAGIDYARGRVIIPMDADLQNDPCDIPRLLDKMDEGYDVVSGWRKDRQDELLTRLIPSWIANKIISVISEVPLHDYGCSLKAYRREVIKDVRLYGEMHRFVPIYATWQGARVAEIPVTHHARQYGTSKYGLSRTFKVVLDLITVKFMSSYFTKPIYVFGTAGMLSFAAAFFAVVWMLVLKYGYHTTFIETPLPVLICMFFMLGVQLILMGLIAEMLMRTYHESQGKRIYAVDQCLNMNLPGEER